MKIRILHLLLVFSFFMLAFSAKAQTDEDRAKIVEEYSKLNPQSKSAQTSAEESLKQESVVIKIYNISFF